MYSRAVPMPGDEADNSRNAPLYDDSKDACNPDNFKDELKDGDFEIIKARQ